jgi:membrane associated rhomboid family serine protease
MIPITISIIIVTCLVSFTAFSNEKLMGDLIFNPPAINNRKQWYRFFTCGFIHADIMHLAFNMYSFYLFGEIVEQSFARIFGAGNGQIIFLLMYLLSLAVSLLPTYIQNQHNYHYYSLGASGAVSAVVFTGIFIYPTLPLGIFPIPFHIPGFIFGPLYLIISAYLAKKGNGNINHSAHIWGALFGVVFVIISSYFGSDYDLLHNFLQEVSGYFVR